MMPFVLMILSVLFSPPASGVRPAFAFTSDAVFQRGKPIPVWGTSATDGNITLSLAGNRVETYATEGRWKAVLPAMDAGGPHRLIIRFDSLIVLENILIGDVWIAGGQSNMEWRLKQTSTAEEDLPLARNPNIRYMHIPVVYSDSLQESTRSTGWRALNEQTAGDITGVGYYFASMLQDSLQIPIGIIQSFRGATRVEPWIPNHALRQDPQFEEFNARRERPTDPPSVLYNAMIHPITPIPAQGVIWYQGEGNAFWPDQYKRTFPLLIRSWRDAWNDPELEFYYVQLANFKAKQTVPVESTNWPALREAQSMTQSVPLTGMAVILDVGDANDIHPRDKKSVGQRLARQALKKTYGKTLVHSGPEVDRITFSGNEAHVHLRPSLSQPVLLDAFPNGFAIAGEDSIFHWAHARLEGDRVVLSTPEVSKAVIVRYAWAENPILSLFNKEGLPASSFRSDE